jgi:hypothetical protein
MKRLLPVGTVLKLNPESDEKVMIIGRLVKDGEGDKMWDYCGCMVPHGINSEEKLAFFDQEQIKQLLFIGFQDEEELKYGIALATYKEEQTKQISNKV